MADEVTVAVTRNNQGTAINEIVTFSDKKNNNIQLVGVPGRRYDLSFLANVTINEAQSVAVNSLAPNVLVNLEVQTPSPVESITFTDSLGHTLTILGQSGVAYDLDLMSYLLAVVSAQDQFMQMMFGSDYLNVKNEWLSRANLV